MSIKHVLSKHCSQNDMCVCSLHVCVYYTHFLMEFYAQHFLKGRIMFIFLHPSVPVSGLVKAINTAVDLIVAHFGTSRDAGVKVVIIISY